MEFLKVFFGGIVIVMSMTGWGFLFSRLVLKKIFDWGFYGGLGLALAVIFGGVLNIVGKIGYFWNTAFLLTGLIAFFLFIFQTAPGFVKKLKRPTGASLLVIALALVLILVKYSAAVSPGPYNAGDDYQGYFVFSEKMWQTGSVGEDPFSERKIVTSLGGQYYLDSFIFNFGKDKNLALLDLGIGYIIFLACLLGLLKRLKLSFSEKSLIFFAGILVFAPTVNITGLYIAAVMFLCLYRICFLTEPEELNIKNIILLSLLVAGVSTLKNSLIPFAGLLLLGYCYFLPKSGSKFPAKTKYFALAMVLTILLLTPWMLSMYSSSGTPLYPFLGKGFHGSSYGNFLTPLAHISINNFLTFFYSLQEVLFLSLGFLLVYAVFRDGARILQRPENKVMLFVFVAVIGAGIMTGGYGVYRYTFAFVFPFVLAFCAKLMEETSVEQTSPNTKTMLFLSVLAICVLIGSGTSDFFAREKSTLGSIAFGLKNLDVVSSEEAKEYKDMQQTVPSGEIIMARLDKNFLFDFNRNTVYIADYPGGSSLPPGMPYKKGGEALSEYLLSKSIRYVAYSYKTQALVTREIVAVRLDPNFNSWIRSESENALDFQDSVEELAKSRKRIFDDGNIYVLDLAEKN